MQIFFLMQDNTHGKKLLLKDLTWKLMGFNLKLEENTQKSQFTFETNEDPIIGKKYVPQV
jgi:hypothetical protein